MDHEAEYDSVLVHYGDGVFDPQLMATAVRLAARKRRGIHVLVTIPVPYSLPIEADMTEEGAAAQSIIEEAKLQGGRRVSGHWEKVRAGGAGRRIIEEAVDMRAAAVVMALPRRAPGQSLFGKTLEIVLTERPCRVIIESAPPDGKPGATAAHGAPRRRGRERRHADPVRRDGRARARDDRDHARARRRPARRRPRRGPAVRRRRGRAAVGGARAPMRLDPPESLRRGLEFAVRLEAPKGLRRGLGAPALFAIVQGFVAASIYFALGLVFERALGMTPLVFLAAGLFMVLLIASYMEGASLHQERGGATVIARYAFNELWSFAAGWAILLDYLILIAICALAATGYAAVLWEPLGSGAPQLALAFLDRRGDRGLARARRLAARLRARRAARRGRPGAPAAHRAARAGAALRARGAHRAGRVRRLAHASGTRCSPSR